MRETLGQCLPPGVVFWEEHRPRFLCFGAVLCGVTWETGLEGKTGEGSDQSGDSTKNYVADEVK